MKKNFQFPFIAYFAGKKYSHILVVLMLLLCAVIVGISFWSIKLSESLHGDIIRTQIYDLKKSFLQDSVENMILHIDAVREIVLEQEKEEAQILIEYTAALLTIEALNSFDEIRRLALASVHHLIVKSTADDKIVISTIAAPETADVVLTKTVQKYLITCIINQEEVDNKTKKIIHDEIHAQKFHNNSYMWVNEVLHWEGGEGYAIRRIHPNLKDTEGMYLSTETKDIKGNKPYLEELEGIKEKGSLFSKYYFKRLENDEISEKLTYASLYRDYNWIVAMGIHVDDLEYFVQEIRKSSEKVTARIYIVTALFIIFFFLGFIILLSITGLQYIKQTRSEIRREANRDPLTGALNRRIGIDVLRKRLNDVKNGKRSFLMFSIDIDDFKLVNDTYGHSSGDIVLKKLVSIIRKTMRESDFVFRWGGEEFLILYEADRDQVDFLARRLNKCVAQTLIDITYSNKTLPHSESVNITDIHHTFSADNELSETGTDSISITISIGVSWFDPADMNYQAVLKRSDFALYEAKRAGKNTFRIQEP